MSSNSDKQQQTIYNTGEFLPAIKNAPEGRSIELVTNSPEFQAIQNNPAIVYLMTLSSKKSRQTMRSFLNTVAKMVGFQGIQDCPWHTLRRLHVQAVIEMLSDAGRAPATINIYLSALKSVAREAWSMNQIDTDSYQHIKHVRSVKGTRLQKGRALTRQELETLFFTCEKDTTAKGVRDAAIFSIMVGCGLRRSEVVSLNYESIVQREQALIVMGKGNKERMAYMPDGTFKKLQAWITEVRGHEPGPLFNRIRRFDEVTDSRLTDQAIYHLLDTRRLEAGLDKFAPHDMRRTFATIMLDNGVDIVTLKDAMGHNDIATTQKYDRRGDDRLKSASFKIKI